MRHPSIRIVNCIILLAIVPQGILSSEPHCAYRLTPDSSQTHCSLPYGLACQPNQTRSRPPLLYSQDTDSARYPGPVRRGWGGHLFILRWECSPQSVNGSESQPFSTSTFRLHCLMATANDLLPEAPLISGKVLVALNRILDVGFSRDLLLFRATRSLSSPPMPSTGPSCSPLAPDGIIRSNAMLERKNDIS